MRPRGHRPSHSTARLRPLPQRPRPSGPARALARPCHAAAAIPAPQGAPARCSTWPPARRQPQPQRPRALGSPPLPAPFHLNRRAGKNFTEGWVEFEDKRVAKAVAATLNGQQIGGKKRSAYYYDIWNVR